MHSATLRLKNGVGLACSVFASLLFLALPARAQSTASPAQHVAVQSTSMPLPILEAIDHADGCCEAHINMAHLRVFADGRIEWDEKFAVNGKWQFPRKTSTATKKELKAVRWAVNSMSGLASIYSTPAAENNIDNDDWIEITGRSAKKTRNVTVAFGSSIDEANYASAPPGLKTLVCTIAIIRNSRTHEDSADLAWCSKYYVGY